MNDHITPEDRLARVFSSLRKGSFAREALESFAWSLGIAVILAIGAVGGFWVARMTLTPDFVYTESVRPPVQIPTLNCRLSPEQYIRICRPKMKSDK